ncbi:uncharacterized protein LOC117335638 [Pecten maximus]|uniref:uncharacterized protein LOC117335638 n=1 Tax=Pecten maximus TaxID=6579 RepID=UPI001457F920|nr:uncharacterized protein LOC117335638 [Pecten maximus]
MISVRTFLLLAMFGVITAVSRRCSPSHGPPGDAVCLRVSGYIGYQWATCLTDTYIKIKSNNRHACEGTPSTRYCYYQCMCERYDKCDGHSVRGLCSCNPTDTSHTPASLVPLPSWCFSPNGTTCSWYNDCLQKRYPCPGSSAANALILAKNFCDLYADHKNSISTNGQDWIGAVSKCLQFVLVPILRPWENLAITCTSIKNVTSASHSKCFSGLPFCPLSFSDQMTIFWTIKGGFTDAFVDAMKSFWEIVYGCLKQHTTNVDLTDNKLARVKVIVKKHASMDNTPDIFAGRLVDAIALKQKWAANGLAWYGFHEVAKTSTDFSVNIVLAQKSDFDLNALIVPLPSLRNVITSLGDSINGSLTCIRKWTTSMLTFSR